MPAYLIVTREGPVRDPAAMQDYHRLTRTISGDFRLTPLVAYGAIEPLEGTPPEAVILMRFPTAADARAFYESEAYQAVLPYRLKAADHRAIIVEGLDG